jgi:hypothetical protein
MYVRKARIQCGKASISSWTKFSKRIQLLLEQNIPIYTWTKFGTRFSIQALPDVLWYGARLADDGTSDLD